MRGVVFEGPGRVAVRDLPEPEILEPGDAVVRVTRTAICGSDLHLLHGKVPMEPGEPLGHEAAGVVEAVGPEVRHFVPGDRVVVSFMTACGACWFCEHEQPHMCEDWGNFGAGIFGGSLGGCQAERLRVPVADFNLLRIPDGVDDDRAVFVGDGLTTAVYGAGLGGILEGDTVAVVGLGPIGSLAAQAAKLWDPAQVIGLDMDPERLAVAATAGITTVDVTNRNAVMAVADRTDGRGADVVIEAVGTPPAFERAVDVVRRGGRISVVGLYSGEQLQIALGIYWARALQIRFGGICPVQVWWERAMDAVARRRIDPLPVVSHRLPLDEAPRGYELFDARKATKVLLTP